MNIKTQCTVCGSTRDFELDAGKVLRWKNGEYVQRVFPELTASEREQLISGTCPACWDKMFGGDE